MSASRTHASTEPGILLATDLGFRCDRAAARAVALARQVPGHALAATVLEPAAVAAAQMDLVERPAWYRPSEPQVQADRRLRRVLGDTDGGWQLHVSEGHAGEQLATLMDQAGNPLLVTGPVREGVLRPTVLGSTVDRLLRRAGTALLMVRMPAHADYRHLLVASDFSAPSRVALVRARALFPQARLTVLHGFDVPKLGLRDTTREAAIEQARSAQTEAGRAFLRGAGLDSAEVELCVEHGEPARLLQQYIETYDPGLVVVGSHGRGAAYALAVGSVTRRILGTVEADVLVVHEDRVEVMPSADGG